MTFLVGNSNHNTRLTLHECCRGIVYAFVILSLWQAPVPWLHHHTDSCDTLQTHLANYRHESPANGRWHLHFTLLSDVLRGCGCPIPPTDETEQEDATPALPTVETHSNLLRLDLAGVSTSWDTTEQAAVNLPAVSSVDDRLLSRQSLSHFAMTGTLLPLLCIARC